MNHRKIKVALGVAMILLLLPCAAYVVAPGLLGRIEAKFDLWRGSPCFLVYGYPSFMELVGVDRYSRRSVRYRRIAGCMVSRSIIEYADGYNSTVRANLHDLD